MPLPRPSLRHSIYYWKCDRPAAFHGTQQQREPDAQLEAQLVQALRDQQVGHDIQLSPSGSQGNHLTWNARVDGRDLFLRVEDGPEADDHLQVESAVMRAVAATGVPVPSIIAVDASRQQLRCAWQLMERIQFPDLNHWFKQGNLDTHRLAFNIGQAIATWQQITPAGYGPIEQNGSELQGCHASYADYFHLRLDEHLHFLTTRGFLTVEQRDDIAREIAEHRSLLDLPSGCLVHKDLALWNILGSRDHIAAYIDFDDAISGDPLDDLSLLACFHNAAFMQRALAGYQTQRPLPTEHTRRLSLHLLRNMIVKAVIRLGAGYFDRDGSFFLVSSSSTAPSLRETTTSKLFQALHNLREGVLSES